MEMCCNKDFKNEQRLFRYGAFCELSYRRPVFQFQWNFKHVKVEARETHEC